MRQGLTDHQIKTLSFLLKNMKKTQLPDIQNAPVIDITKFNVKQSFALLVDKYIVASYFGLASFNINGVTLHSLLKFPVRGKICCETVGRIAI